MARFSRRRGPAAVFNYSGATAVIPGITLTRSFDDGPVLVLWHCVIFKGTGFSETYHIGPYLNGTSLLPANRMDECTPDEDESYAGMTLVDIPAGVQTIDLRIGGVGNPGTQVLQDRTELIVIQLPQWDSESDLL